MQITNCVKALETQLNQNSKPPLTDPLQRKMTPMSLCKKTGRKLGGQTGHEGNTLHRVEQSDETQQYRPAHCPHCFANLTDAPESGYTRRPFFEMPGPKVIATEHWAILVSCPCCGKVAGTFSAGVDRPAQYGLNLLGSVIYLHAQRPIPYAYTAQVVQDVTDAPLSAGSLHRAMQHADGTLTDFEEQVKSALAAALLKHVDETSGQACGKRHRFRLCSTGKLTHLFVHQKRGKVAVAGLLGYGGRMVSGFFSNYIRLVCLHQFCIAYLTNNEAECDLRLLKARGKISGCFRSLEGAHLFCRVRGYLQSCLKQGTDLLACLRSVFAGDPILPHFNTTELLLRQPRLSASTCKKSMSYKKKKTICQCILRVYS